MQIKPFHFVPGRAAQARGVHGADMLPADRLDQIVQRFGCLEARLNAGAAADGIARVSREYSELGPVVAQIMERRAARACRRTWISPPGQARRRRRSPLIRPRSGRRG